MENNTFEPPKSMLMENFLRLGKTLLGVFALILISGNLFAQDTKLDFTGVGTGTKFEGCERYVVTFKGTYSGSKSIAKAELLDPIIGVGQNDWDNQSANSWEATLSLAAGTYNPTFRVTFTDNTFENAGLSSPIVVFSNPRPNFSIDGNTDQCLESNKYCFLNGTVPGENVTTKAKNKVIGYKWDFGDGGGSSDFEPCYSYQTGGLQYDVSLSVTDEKGCIGDTLIRKYPNVYKEIGTKFRVRVNNPTGAGCPVADVTFFNQSKLDTALVKTWIWDWGIGKKHIDTFSADSANHWNNWWNDFDKEFSKDGWISPKLVIITNDGCRDSFILKNAFQVVNYNLAFTWTPDTQCFAGNNVTFRMKPRPNAQAFLWTFGDPLSMMLNFNDESWSPSHSFVEGPGWYNVTLSILESPCPVRDTTICFIKLKGPGVMIQLPPPPAFPAHSCVEPREIPIEDFERLKYDACYRESYDPSVTQYAGIMPTSTLNPLNEVPIEQGYIRWVEVDDTLIEMDSFFVYCNADTQWTYDMNGDTFFNIDTIKTKAGTDNANGNAIVTPRQSGIGSVGCNDYHEYDGTLARAIILNRGQNYKPGTYRVIFTDDSSNTNDGKGRVVINLNGTLDSVYIEKGGSGYHEFDDTARMEFVDPTAVGGNGKLKVIAIANDDVYVSDTIFTFVAPDPGVNGNWRISSSQKWRQVFKPIWNYTDPIPVERALKVKDFVKPVGGGAAVVKEFTIFHPFIRTHKVNIGGTDYTYRPASNYKVEYIDDNGNPQTYYPPMYRGTSPLNPFPSDKCTDNFETMHDTDLFNCSGPNLVTFTSHVTKYRLFDRGGTDMPPHPMYSTTNMSHALLGRDDLIDSCKQNSNVPWGTDSVTYFWDFGDGDPCSMVVRNGVVVAVDQSGLLPLQDPLLCQYSNMAAPKHLFIDNDCFTPRLTVYDPVTDCQAVSTVNIVNRGPDAGPGEPGGPLTKFDVNSYNQGVLKDENGDDIRMGAQVGRTDAPCAANSFNQYFQNIDVGETEPTCGKEDYWMVFDAKNDCTNEDCITNSNGELFVIKILDGGSLYKQGSYNVTFTAASSKTTSGHGIATIGRLGNLQKVVITDPGSGFTDQDTAYMEFDDPSLVQGNGKLKVLALAVKENFYRNGIIQEVEIKQRGAFYNQGVYDVYFPYKGVTDSAYGKVTVGSLGFVESIQMLSYGSGYPRVTDTIWMEFADPDLAGGNCKVLIAALAVERNYYASCPWIPKLVIEMILGNRWSYSTPGWKDIGMVVKVGDCFDTFFYENYKYIIDANADFYLSPNPMTYDNTGNRHVIESGREFTSTLSAEPCNMPRKSAKTQLPTRMPMDVTLSVKEDTRNDPNKLTNDSIKKYQYFIIYEGDPCGKEPFTNEASVKLGKFQDGSSYREDTVFGQCGGKDQLGDTSLMNLYDTSTFTFRAPGKYRYTATAESKYGINVCSGGGSRQIWFGQFQCFTISDNIVCGPDIVEFRDSIHYWQDQIICDLGNDFNNKTCIDRTLFFYSPDSNAKRKAWYKMAGYTGPKFREAIAWDFNSPRFRTDTLGDTIKRAGKPVRMQEWQRKLDSNDIEVWIDMDTIKGAFGRRLFITQAQRDQLSANDSLTNYNDSLLHFKESKGNSARFSYDSLGVGAYDVTLWARDSMGCWTPRTVKDAVRVVGVQANFVYDNAEDSIRVCVPQDYQFQNRTLIFEPNDSGTTVDTSNVVGINKSDSVIFQEWWFGDEFGTNRDTSYLRNPIHRYLKVDTFTMSIAVETYQGCKDIITKKNFVKLIGPRLDSAFSIREDTGCVTFRVVADVPVPDGNRYALQWELGDGTQQPDRDFNTISRLDYAKVGRFPLFLTIFDTIVNNNDTNLCYDRLPRTDPSVGEDTVWVTVLGLDSIATDLSNRDVCPGDEVTLRIDGDNQFAMYDTLFWTALGGYSDTVLSDVGAKISFDQPGKYWVRLTGSGDWPICPTDAYDTIRVKNALADVEIEETNVRDSLLANYNFLNKSLPANAYKWEIYELPSMTLIDEFERSENDTSDLRYDKFGQGKGDQKAEYLIVLTATVSSNDNDPNPCVSSDSVRVTYDPGFGAFNVFTPNNDGKNDYFALDLQGAIEYKITIYNRWGEIVNRVTEEDEVSCVENENSGNMTCAFWDGTNFRTGSKAASGTYYYLFEYKYKGDGDDADMRKHHGTVTLLR